VRLLKPLAARFLRGADQWPRLLHNANRLGEGLKNPPVRGFFDAGPGATFDVVNKQD
jgi:hypothetical protein